MQRSSLPPTVEPADLFPVRAARTGLFLAGGVLGFPIVAAFVAVASPRLAVLQHRSMPGLAANHLVTLLWGTMIAIGALHQLLPAAVGVRREPGRLVLWQFLVHVLGVVLMTAGFLGRSVDLLVAGAAAVVASIAILLGVAASLIRQRRRTLPVLRFVIAALASLGATATWGLVLAANWKFVFWRDLIGPMGLAVHLALGLVGWFAFLITGVSYYLLPRFAGTGDLPGIRPEAVFWTLGAGLLLLLASALLGPPLARAGGAAVGAAGLLYTADLVRYLRAWRPHAPDITRAHWQVLAGEGALLSLGVLAWATGLLPGAALRWGVAGITLFLLGWVTLAITGQAFKVTPFLMWYYRFHLGMSALEVPRLPAPYWPRAALAPFVLLAAAPGLIALGVLRADPLVATAGGVGFLAGACLFAFVLGYSWLPAWWSGRRPPRAAEPR